MKFGVIGVCVLCLVREQFPTTVAFGNDNDEGLARDNTEENLEFKQTIVVSTKLLNNNNRRGIQAHNNGDSGILTYKIEETEKPRKVFVPDVPVVKGFKAVETTNLKPPRFNRPAPRKYPDYLVNRNIRNEYDLSTNLATPINANGFEPSSIFNNINWWNDDSGYNKPRYDFGKRFFNEDDNTVKLHGKTNDDSIKEFYCRRCRELSQSNLRSGCFGETKGPVTPSWLPSSTITTTTSSTTAMAVIDGKLAEFT